MPTYTFQCECGHWEDFMLPMKDRNTPQRCKECGGMMKRGIDLPAIHGLSTSTGVKAWGIPPKDDGKKVSGNF